MEHSKFLEKFGDRISVVTKDGNLIKKGPESNDPPRSLQLAEAQQERYAAHGSGSSNPLASPSNGVRRASAPCGAPPGAHAFNVGIAPPLYSPSFGQEKPRRRLSAALKANAPGRPLPPALPPPPPEASSKIEITPENALYFSKKPREVEFKPYGLKEYQAIQPALNCQLTSLGPEPPSEELLNKRSIQEKIKQFGEESRARNAAVESTKAAGRMHAPHAPPPSKPTARAKALEYAKEVPRPRVRQKSRDRSPSDAASADGDRRSGVGTPCSHVSGERGLSELEELELQHQRSRDAVDAIRRDLQNMNVRC